MSQLNIPDPDYLYVNEDNIDEELKCPICFIPFIESILHNHCDNSFCKECIKKINYKCPFCSNGDSKENLIKS